MIQAIIPGRKGRAVNSINEINLAMPVLETARLTIRPFTADDLAAIHDILDHQLGMERPMKLASAGWNGPSSITTIWHGCTRCPPVIVPSLLSILAN
jgi:hypothetical protein